MRGGLLYRECGGLPYRMGEGLMGGCLIGWGGGVRCRAALYDGGLRRGCPIRWGVEGWLPYRIRGGGGC